MALSDFIQQPTAFPWFVWSLVTLTLLLFISNIWLIHTAYSLKKRQNTLFKGNDPASAENVLQRHSEEIDEIDKEIQQLFEISNSLHNLGQKSVHRVGFVRFNPFKDVGGNQSFSLALMDGKNNGVVISSLHTRESSRVYAKPRESGQSSIPLTEEERQAIAMTQSKTVKQ